MVLDFWWLKLVSFKLKQRRKSKTPGRMKVFGKAASKGTILLYRRVVVVERGVEISSPCRASTQCPLLSEKPRPSGFWTLILGFSTDQICPFDNCPQKSSSGSLSCNLCPQWLSCYLLGRLSTNGLFMRLASLSQGILPNFGTETWREMERDHFAVYCVWALPSKQWPK